MSFRFPNAQRRYAPLACHFVLLALLSLPLLSCARNEQSQKSQKADSPLPPQHTSLRVCADPNNLPFSNDRLEGFENKIAALVARELNVEVEYTWWAQRRGFFRNTLRAGECDLVVGVPSSFELALTTSPYYRSTYVFVYRKDNHLKVRSFDDAVLRQVKIGVQMIGDDFANTPPAHALSNRGIIGNVRGYTLYGDYREANPPARISRLWWLMLYVCTAVFIIVIVTIFVAVYRSRAKRDAAAAAATLTPDPRSEQRMARVITGAVVLTSIILFVFLIATFRTGKGYYTLQDAQPVSIKVTGHQWWWEVEYEDPVPSNIFKTANEIHIPVGRLVQLQLTSTDVIHSFWAPNLDGKKDLLPGHDSNIWLKADREGEFAGQCAEFCGHQHAHMRFLIIAESEDKFSAWMEAQRKPAAPPADQMQSRGQQVFLSSPCIMCHTVRGTDASGSVAPELTHLASRKMIAAGTLPLTREHLAGWITNSQEIKPGNRMPPVPLSPEELQALLTYLESLK